MTQSKHIAEKEQQVLHFGCRGEPRELYTGYRVYK